MVKLLLGTDIKNLSIEPNKDKSDLLCRYMKENAANQCVRIYRAIKD